MAISLPDDQHRLRCGRCGNLTRFDIVRTSKLKEFWHVDMSGQASVENPEVLDESISSITCRWCGATDEVEHVLRPSAGGSDTEPDTIK